jgi:hypothetical protein
MNLNWHLLMGLTGAPCSAIHLRASLAFNGDVVEDFFFFNNIFADLLLTCLFIALPSSSIS